MPLPASNKHITPVKRISQNSRVKVPGTAIAQHFTAGADTQAAQLATPFTGRLNHVPQVFPDRAKPT
jgi:hypothetical protein